MNWQAERWAGFWRVLRGEADASMRVMVIAAHPDDETIGASILLARFPQIQVVYLTDGAPRNRRFWPADMNGPREDYSETRKREAQAAAAHAGVRPEQIAWLGAVDQEAIFLASGLTDKFAEFLRKHQPEIVVTHPYEGGHPDHDTAALIARMAISRVASRILLLEMTSYHARSGQCVTGAFLSPEPTETICELTAADCLRKRRMMDEHASQRAVLEGFSIDRERFRPAPKYDFTKPPHDGRLWYECMEWPMAGREWRSAAADAIREMQECNATHSA